MISELKLPELGENIDSGNVVKVLVSVGQTIAEDEPVLELETDKATIEVPSNVAGVVKEIHVSEGGKASVGQVVLSVETDSKGAVEEAPKKIEPAEEERREAAAETEARSEAEAAAPKAEEVAEAAPPVAEARPVPEPTDRKS